MGVGLSLESGADGSHQSLNVLRRQQMTLYVKTTADKYRLPLAVADSKRELAEMLGISPESVRSGFSHKHNTYYMVEVEDDTEQADNR